MQPQGEINTSYSFVSLTSYHRNFFELVRFDFVIDENFIAWLMEVYFLLVITKVCSHS